MSDTPVRSVARQTLDPFARQLLESARSDSSEPGARDRALLALGLAPVALLAVTPSAAAASAASPGGLLAASSKAVPWLVGKSLAIGLLGSVVTLGVLDRALNGPTVARAVPASSVASAVTRTTPVTAPSAPSLAMAEASTEAPAGAANTGSSPNLAALSATDGPHETPPPARAQASAPSVASYGDGLLELEALARVRRASAHEPGRALQLLDDFERSFPGSRVAEEAAVLRIEALRGLGRTSEAHALALSFLRERPLSVYAAKVRAVSQVGDQGSNQGH